MELYVQPVGGLQTNCYIVASKENRAAIIDPGDDFAALVKSLETYGLAPAMILLTHGHFDHIGAVNQLREKYRIPVYASREELPLLTDIQRNRARYHRVDKAQYNVQPDHFYADGDSIALDELTFEVIATPGHTPGGVCLACENLLFTGDTLFPNDVGRCDMFGGDFPAMKRSMEKLKALKKDYMVLPGHGPHTTLDQEKAQNPYMTGKV